MLRTHQSQTTLWDTILPESLLKLPAELEYIDQILNDERFMASFLASTLPWVVRRSRYKPICASCT
ncbi:hypothetical protein SAMN05443507_12024 [Alicyclobacillus tolerans]|uniref:Uncharacterized protein n=1 Tax=Alicyclobacillus tolerans TaxID=90970 RepID=A0A1M6ULJ4_9BACL|nr:hypothetical protein SAMN05443507_12024 [Alicyclobacillus montanus]